MSSLECARHAWLLYNPYFRLVKCVHLDHRFVVWVKRTSGSYQLVDYEEFQEGRPLKAEHYGTKSEEEAQSIFQSLEAKLRAGFGPIPN